VRRFAILLLALPIAVFSQQAPQSADQQTQTSQGQNTLTTLAGQFFSGDFVNLFGTAAGVYDANQAISSQSNPGGGGGFALSGGVQAFHRWRDSELSLSYNLGYTHYQSVAYSSGFNQNLSLAYTKILNARWSLGLVESGGMYRYGVSYYGQPNGPTPAIANPFSPVTKFASSGVSLTYRQTARLSYIFSGNFYLARYNYPGAIGTTGGSGSGSVSYRFSDRTTIGGTYTHSYFTYQRSAGQATIDGAYLNFSHQFPQFWTVNLDAGVSRSNSSGFIRTPVNVILNGQEVTGYVVGPYKLDKLTPSVSGSVSRRIRRMVATASVGQGVNPGNGVYLASRNQFIAGTLSYTPNTRSNISASGGWFHLTSLANTVSSSYSTGSFGVSYGYTLTNHLSANARYDYFRYGGLYAFAGTSDNRLSFGITFSSRSIPLTLY
jgi:hypothetical protein